MSNYSGVLSKQAGQKEKKNTGRKLTKTVIVKGLEKIRNCDV